MASAHSELARLSRDWTKLGRDDPLWAVCVDADRKSGQWDLAEFLASGEAEVGAALDRLTELGICAAREAALDFGCGVGRLTGPLSRSFGSVVGVDISTPMLDMAQGLLAGESRCTFVHNENPDLRIFPDASFDLVYSSLVLQHMPRALATRYLTEFVRVARPGGAVVILVPDAHRLTPGGAVYAMSPRQVTGLIQRKIFGYPAPMQMTTLPARRVRRIAEGAGASLIASDPRCGVGDHWRMKCHFIVKDALPAGSDRAA
jgi:ubiquinone/menaquinone biosynthesis C-methylase UbiE